MILWPDAFIGFPQQPCQYMQYMHRTSDGLSNPTKGSGYLTRLILGCPFAPADFGENKDFSLQIYLLDQSEMLHEEV